MRSSVIYFSFMVFALSLLGGCDVMKDEHIKRNPDTPKQIEVTSHDGVSIFGQVDFPIGKSKGVFILVHGTGRFTRDVSFSSGKQSTPGLFVQLSKALTSNGYTVVRYDRRGVPYNNGQSADTAEYYRKLSGEITTEDLWQDARAVIDFTHSTIVTSGNCLGIIAHSEGMAHVGRMASNSDISKIDVIIGIGALLESPLEVLRWQLTNRDRDSLLMMDENKDGFTSNEEVEKNWVHTPSAVFNRPDLLKHPSGEWTEKELESVVENQTELYEKQRKDALARSDSDYYPNTEMPLASYQWWKSWFVDDATVASRLVGWGGNLILHYGHRDSQVRFARQKRAIEKAKLLNVSYYEYKNLGHSLGDHVLFGPIDALALEQIIEKIDCNGKVLSK